MTKELRLSQKIARRFCLTHECGALIADMGLGKTTMALASILAFIHRGLTKGVLIVAPLRVCEEVWQQEAQDWPEFRWLKFSLMIGSAAKRLAALNANANIYLINFENLIWLSEILKRRKHAPFDVLFVDESSFMKSSKSKRFKKFRQVLAKTFERRYIMTGSLRPNKALDLWAPYYLLDDGARLGDNYERFKRRHFEQVDYNGYKWEPRKGAEQTIRKLIGDITLRFRKQDWLKNLPPIIENKVYVRLPKRAAQQYADLEKDFLLELGKGTQILAPTAAAKLGKMHQFANGAVYVDDEDGNRIGWQEFHKTKLDALREIVQESESNLIVVYNYKHDAERIVEAFPECPIYSRKHKRSKTLLREWNAGKHKIMAVHAASAGYGLNMQHGGHTIVFFSMTYSLEQLEQVIARLGDTRQVGLSDKVLVHYILARDTIDDVIMDAVKTKEYNQTSFMNALLSWRKRHERTNTRLR